MNNQDIEFVDPWGATEDKAQTFSKELERELHEGHSLYGKKYRIIARRYDRDDILLQLENSELAIVHLTWSQKKESSGFPSVHYLSVQEFIEEMDEENQMYR